jgi:hypothetical protein
MKHRAPSAFSNFADAAMRWATDHPKTVLAIAGAITTLPTISIRRIRQSLLPITPRIASAPSFE